MSAQPIPQTRVDAQQVVTEVVWSRVFGRDHQAVAQAHGVATAIVFALRREGLLTGTSQADAGEILEKYATTLSGEPPIRGISHLVAEALVLLNLPVVHRDTVQALMPQANAKGTQSTISMQFRRALRKFHGWKWIERSDDGLITVLNWDALVQWFSTARDLNEDRASTVLDLAGAIAHLNASVAAGDVDEVRRTELLAIERLMRAAPGSVTNERGMVRIVPKATAL